MKRSAPMNRGSGGLSRSTPLARGSGLARRSAKTAKAYAGGAGAEGRRAFVARILGARPDCEANITGICTWRSVDVHEVLRRSAGGDIVDDGNVKALCRPCHDWIHTHPREARRLGLLASRFAPPAPTRTT
jgi:hypothetical protein